ncbi:MAG: hypothetical protein IAG13_22630 [Deltaproteobacteria bacterium]|nr:hypothetical protein [Nannocystaceae bacterium]
MAQPVDLSGWILTVEPTSPDAPHDPADDADKLEFAAGTTLAPGGWLVIVTRAVFDRVEVHA